MKTEKNDKDSSSEEEETSMNLLPTQPSTTATKNVGQRCVYATKGGTEAKRANDKD